MYVLEVIIDGFKSYSTRTVVGNFDPHFNAITGLNGSGKSNILDAICFVLGISNLSQVRVSNLQELVYKQGQAGITKASVTIVFNNSDPKCSPVGYEQHSTITVTRQIAIGGKNKFIINGRSSLQKDVENLFHSVQLNVNNPHFLIMQGRITKVLNMKPPEILSMIEEAAGTRMYETKKQNAQKTMEKKHQKVQEITQVMDGEITPQLEKLRTERQNYSAYSSNSSELEKLERFLIAFEYYTNEDKIRENELNKSTTKDRILQLQHENKEHTDKAEVCVRKASELEKEHSSEAETLLLELKKQEAAISVAFVKSESNLKNTEDSLKQEKDSLVSLQKQEQTVKKQLADKEVEYGRCVDSIAAKAKDVDEAEAHAEAMRERYQNACAGIANEGDAALLSLPEQVATWERAAREADSKLQQGRLRAQHNSDRLPKLNQQLQMQQNTHKALTVEMDRIRESVTAAEKRLSDLNYDSKEEDVLKTRASVLRGSISKIGDKVNSISAQVEARLRFEFKDPVRDFDRSKIKGVVAKLFNVKDPRTALALEIVAGGKLQSIVVDNEQTSKLILEKGGLKKRTTFYPLNKLTANCTSAAKVRSAKEIAVAQGSTANLALELVEYEEEVKKAIEFVFGNTMICGSKEAASAITYNPSIGGRSVTIEGDSYNSDGTLSGGAKTNLGETLVKLGELHAAQSILEEQEAELKVVTDSLRQMEVVSTKARDIASEIARKKNELASCEEKEARSSFAQIANEVKTLETELVSWEQEIIRLTAACEHAKEQLQQLKDCNHSQSSQREKAMKSVELDMKAATKAASAVKVEANALQRTGDTLHAEVAAAKSEAKAVGEQLVIATNAVKRINTEVEALQVEVAKLKRSLEDAKSQVSSKQEEFNQSSKEIKSLMQQKDKCLKAAKTCAQEEQSLGKRLSEIENTVKENRDNMTSLVKKHVWIEKDKGYFGTAGSSFDFAADDIPKSKKRLLNLREDQDRLSKTINRKVIGMIAEAEKQYEDLKSKREVVVRDKAKIEAVIEELDHKKTEALQRTWVRVNADFGSIFSTLLPGCTAKLEPPEKSTVMDGLEVKVAFHDVWKDSLTELSGGQRSLLALSLILSLLLFKPAPMYILDEVDSALDLSHTENIGLMLRTHFSSSQFIVVSLKEGMFNNANVIFRTRFVDGLSTVTRTCPGGRGGRSDKQLTINNAEPSAASAEREPAKKKGKTVKSRAIVDENELA